jgi:hypothetical protein
VAGLNSKDEYFVSFDSEELIEGSLKRWVMKIPTSQPVDMSASDAHPAAVPY